MGFRFWSKQLLVAGIILYGIVLLTEKAEADSSGNQAPEWVISSGLIVTDLRLRVCVAKLS